MAHDHETRWKERSEKVAENRGKLRRDLAIIFGITAVAVGAYLFASYP